MGCLQYADQQDRNNLPRSPPAHSYSYRWGIRRAGGSIPPRVLSAVRGCQSPPIWPLLWEGDQTSRVAWRPPPLHTGGGGLSNPPDYPPTAMGVRDPPPSERESQTPLPHPSPPHLSLPTGGETGVEKALSGMLGGTSFKGNAEPTATGVSCQEKGPERNSAPQGGEPHGALEEWGEGLFPR